MKTQLCPHRKRGIGGNTGEMRGGIPITGSAIQGAVRHFARKIREIFQGKPHVMNYDSANKLLTLKKTKDNAATPSETVTMSYDRNGNETKESTLLKGARKPTVNTYGYNYYNRMVSALIKGIKNYEFTYNEDGNRIKTKVSNVRGDNDTRCAPPSSGDETVHLYDGSSLIIDLDSKGKVISTYSYGLGLNAIDSKQVKGYYMADALGSITEVTGTRGNVLRSYRYGAWGEITRGGEGKDVNPFLYVGAHGVRWQDNTLGMYHMGYRFYNQGTGRFTQRDPIGYGGSSNFYVYAENTPITKVDSSGLVAVFPLLPVGQWTLGDRINRVNYYHEQCNAGQNPTPLPLAPGEDPKDQKPYFVTTCPNGGPGHGIPSMTGSGNCANSNNIEKYYSSAAASKVRTCALVHEAEHAFQCQCAGSLGYGHNKPKMDCDAYAQELKCLRGELTQNMITSILNNYVNPYYRK